MAETRTLVVPEPDIREMSIRIRGVTPLLCDNGAQALTELKQHRAAKAGKKQTVPEEKFDASLYRTDDGFGFPAAAIARALRDASARFVDRYSGKQVAGAVRIKSTGLRDLRSFRNRYREIEDLLGSIPLVIDETLAAHEDIAA